MYGSSGVAAVSIGVDMTVGNGDSNEGRSDGDGRVVEVEFAQ